MLAGNLDNYHPEVLAIASKAKEFSADRCLSYDMLVRAKRDGNDGELMHMHRTSLDAKGTSGPITGSV